ncbi:MAG: Holliday junction branch migration protein RuvA [Nitrospirae bacterium]|nr:Holliday junction branch migration protein RuvA [Nitrospirota bacterium]
MIASLRGRLMSKRPECIIVETGGVGYDVHAPLTLLSALPDEGSEVFLHIYTHVREEAITLYGFSADAEKRIFMTLLGISGVGPKIALSILSTIPPDDFHRAITTEDTAFLCRVPGLGKKTAQRLILELREKLPSMKEKGDAVFEDTLSALVNLGYKRAFALEALQKVYSSGQRDIETLLRESLKYLTKE